MARKKVDEAKIKVGNIADVSGEVTIAGGDIYKGYTSEQVSVLLTQITSTFQPKPFDGRCPYKGLDVFDEEDAELFFGREKLVDDLVSRVKESQTVFVTGPSGSGKSSLVRAGLIPALKEGAVKELHSERWLYATMKPGRDPIGELARVTARLASSTNAEDEVRAKALTDATIFARWCEIALKEGRDKHAVLFIDQFEEVFTQISKDAERIAFLNLLTHAATIENGRVIILFSMRSDFVSNCATYPQLNALLNQQFIQIGAMQPDELVSAIAQPALRVGLRIDPDLIAQIINDMKSEPGSLPLMQFALKDLFEAGQAKGGIIALTLHDYLQRGGIQKSLERHADAAFAKLGNNEQELARAIFGGLIEIGRGTVDTRRTALFNELIPVNTKAEDVAAIVQKLADARLITTDEAAGIDTVTISHEKLIDAWPWLKKLVNENRDVIALQNEISADAKEWDEHQQDASYLYTGARLINAREKLETKKLTLSGLAQQYIETGIEQEATKRKEEDERQQKEHDRQTSIRRQRKTIIWVSIAMVVSIALAIAAAISGVEALRQSQRAVASLLAAQSSSLVNTQPDLALLLSLESNYIGDQLGESDPIWLGGLETSLNSISKLGTYLRANTGTVRAVSFSPDGHWLASTGEPIDKVGTVILWDMKSKTNPIPYQKFIGGTQRFLSVAFNPDGTLFVAAGDDSKIFVWDPQKCCAPIATWPVNDKVRALAFTKINDQEYVAVTTSSKVTFWDITTGKLDDSLSLQIPTEDKSVVLLSLAVSPTNSALAVGSDDGNVTLWDLNTHEMLFHKCSYGDPQTNNQSVCTESGNGNTEIRGITFTTDGKMLITGSSDDRAWLWDAETGDLLAQSADSNEGGHQNTVSSVAVSPNNDQVATVSWDNTVRLWNLVNQNDTWSFERTDTLAGHSNSIWAAAYSPDGTALATGSSDASVILWKVDQVNQIGSPIAQMDGEVWGLAASSDDKLAAGDEAGNIRIWDFDSQTQALKPESKILKHSGGVLTLTFSHDNKWLASAGYDQTIRVWDVQTGEEAWHIDNAHTDQIWSLMFSPDDKWLASASFDKTAKVWDTTTHQQVGKTLQHHQGVYEMTFNKDGTKLLVAGYEPDIYVWDLTNIASIPDPIFLRGDQAAVNSLAFNPAYPSILASTSDDKTLLLWNVDQGDHTPPAAGFTQIMEAVTFSPNGDWLASATNNSTVLLWQWPSEQCAANWSAKDCQPEQMGTPLTGHQAAVHNVVFLSNTTLISSDANGQLIQWNLDKENWYKRACNIVNRSFNDSEYGRYILGKINTTLLNTVNWFSNRFSSGSTQASPSCISDSLP